MPTIRFPSLMHGDSIGYLLESEFVYSSIAPRCASKIHPQAFFFDTYGDGQTQHSKEIPIPVSYFADWCASLAGFILAGNQVESIVSDMFPSKYDDVYNWEKVSRAASVKHKEEKRVYYNVDTFQTSSADSKRHDRRWEEIPSWADGGMESVFGLLNHGKSISGLELYASYDHLSDILEKITGKSFLHAVHYCKNFAPLGYDPYLAQVSFTTLKHIVESHRATYEAKRSFDSFQRMKQAYDENRLDKETASA